jgi:drug/metabolite transporter (DMT)-like permease
MLFLVLARVFLSVSANTLQKRLAVHRASISHIWLFTYLLMLGPACVLAAICPGVKSGNFWTDILLGGVIDAFGNLAMVAALRLTDLSVFGPLNAFRPVLALLFGAVFLHETPSSAGAIGVGITVVGAFLLLKPGQRNSASIPKEQVTRILTLRLLGLSLSTFAAVFLKRAAGAASAEMTLAGWILCGLICLGITFVFQPSQKTGLRNAFQQYRDGYIWHAALFLAMQWITIRIFQETLLAYSFVFFQLGMILQVMVGRFVFREPAFKRRLAGCVIMALGSALILWKG